MPELEKKQSQPFSVAIKDEKIQQSICNTINDPITRDRFVAEVCSAVANNYTLRKCTTTSIVTSALLAQSLNLPLAQSLGFCYLVPYKNGDYTNAQFQIGWKGLVQLAVRTNQYENIGVRPVHEGEWIGQDEFGEDLFKFDHKYDSAKVVGYYAYFKLLSGFKKTLYWTVEQCEAHGTKYSKAHSGSNKGGANDNWTTMFEAMAMKTVLKQLISKYGVMTTEIQKVVQADQSVIDEKGNFRYVDNEHDDNITDVDEDTECEVTKPNTVDLTKQDDDLVDLPDWAKE